MAESGEALRMARAEILAFEGSRVDVLRRHLSGGAEVDRVKLQVDGCRLDR